MLPFVLRRMAFVVPTLLGVSLVVFLMLQLVPGDPVNALLPPEATEQDRALLRDELGLDEPLYMQYFIWLGDVLQGDLGRSIIRQFPVAELLAPALLNTLLLSFAAALFSFSLSLIIGVYSAFRPKSFWAGLGNMIGTAGVSVPNYWAGLILIGIFAVMLGWFPSSGKSNVGDGSAGDVLLHLLLPAIAAGLTTLGVMTRMIRSTMTDLLKRDFVFALKAKGAPPVAILFHVLKNGMPILLTVAGLQIGYLLGGSVLVETVFAWPGVGQLIYQAIGQRDFPIIQAGVLTVGAIFVMMNLLVDALHAYIDPRLRSS